MPKKCTFHSQMRLFGTRRNPLYKRKHLGRVLEAQDRKSAPFDQKIINPTPTAEISLKCIFADDLKIPAKMPGNHKMLYHLCFKHMSRLQTSLVLGPEDHKIREICEFCEIG